MRSTLAGSVLVAALLAASQLAAAAAPAAEVLLLTGRGTATNPADGGIRELAKGDAVFAGEVVNSSVNSYVNLKFADGSYILLRPNTRFVIEDYAYGEAAAAPAPAPAAPAPRPAEPKPAPGAAVAVPPPAANAPPPVVAPAPQAQSASASRAFFRLLKGGFRAVSGLIGKADRNEYKVSTPVATIGIRGTDYLAVICDAACARDAVIREDLPPGAGAEGGLVAGVMEGGIGVTSGSAACLDAASGELRAAKDCPHTELAKDSFLAVTAAGRHVPLASMPRFLMVDPIPNPTTVCAQ